MNNGQIPPPPPPPPSEPTTPVLGKNEILQMEEETKANARMPMYKRAIGMGLAVLSAFFFSIQTLFVKRINNIDPMEITFFRMLIQCACITPVLIYSKETAIGASGDRIMLLLRAFFGSSSMCLMYYALHHMPIGDASVIHFSSPVFVGIMAFILLKERCGFFEILTTTITLSGVILIAQPQFMFPVEIITDPQEGASKERLIASTCALVASVCGAAVHISLRKLKHVHFSTVIFTYSVYGMMQSAVLTFIVSGWKFPACWKTWTQLLGVGVTAVIAQTCFTKALHTENAGTVAVLRTMEIVFAFIWQSTIMNQYPNKYSIAGTCLISLCALGYGIRKWYDIYKQEANLGTDKQQLILEDTVDEKTPEIKSEKPDAK